MRARSPPASHSPPRPPCNDPPLTIVECERRRAPDGVAPWRAAVRDVEERERGAVPFLVQFHPGAGPTPRPELIHQIPSEDGTAMVTTSQSPSR